MSRAFATVAVAVAMIAAPAALAAEPQASLPDIEDEVMCPICGTLLELSEAPQAERERAFIRDRIAGGESKEQIKDALVAEYGPEVLATPESSGFNLSAYVVPIVALVLALIALVVAVLRWRGRGRDDEAPVRREASEDSERLDADLARYDL